MHAGAVDDLKDRVRLTPSWLKSVQAQADEKKISLDSMLTRTAEYVLRTRLQRKD